MKINLNQLGKKITQVILIFLIAVCCGSMFFVLNTHMIEYTVIVLFALLYIVNPRNRSPYPLYACGILLAAIIFVRIMMNNLGIELWLLSASQILVVYCAYYIDRDNFLRRFVMIVEILALFSLAFWLMQLFSPSILDSILTNKNILWNKSETYQVEYKGMFLYCYARGNRNTGMYTEPGRYQALLHGALFAVLFCQKYIKMTTKQTSLAIIILSITILSTQATTGYIMLAVQYAGFLIMNKRGMDRKIRNTILGLVIIAAGFLAINYFMYGSNSLVGEIVMGKLDATDVTDNESSGGARIRMIQVCFDLIGQNPFGAGTFIVEGNIVAAGFLKMFVVIGIIPALALSIWIFYPFRKAYDSKIPFIVFLLIYIYLGLAQTYFFYSGLLVIPIFLQSNHSELKRIKHDKVEKTI